jgi:hypothetical protein
MKDPIYIDGDKTAELNHGAITEQFLTLQEAVIAFHQLPPERKETATIITVEMTYSAPEIDRFHYGLVKK